MIYEIERTHQFDLWLKKLKDRQAVLAVTKRLTRIALGNFGDSKPVGDDVYELRFFIGPGYRVYYTIQNKKIIFLLNGGDKSTQLKDIKKAKQISKKLKEQNQYENKNSPI
jgi:putative addiction module killer protein